MKTWFELCAGWTKINNFYLVFLAVREHDIFWFKVTVNYSNFLQMGQRIQKLESYLSEFFSFHTVKFRCSHISIKVSV